MAQGPGKYDDMATYVREQTNARGVIVIVVGGNKGSGFSVQGMSDDQLLLQLPAVLHEVAETIARDSDIREDQ